MKHTLLQVLALCTLVLLMGACRSTRHAQRRSHLRQPDEMVVPSGATVNTPTTANPTVATPSGQTDAAPRKQKDKKKLSTSVPALASKLSLRLSAGERNVKLGGSFHVKRGSVVQIHLVYNALFIGVNVGTLEITPEGILVIDRLHKRYCRATYDELPLVGGQRLDYSLIEPLFWGEADEGMRGSVQFGYDNWKRLSDGQFPQSIEFTVTAANLPLRAQMSLSNLVEADNWDDRTTVGSDYESMSPQAAMSMIVSLIK